jgi:hypothetical protein
MRSAAASALFIAFVIGVLSSASWDGIKYTLSSIHIAGNNVPASRGGRYYDDRPGTYYDDVATVTDGYIGHGTVRD